MIRTLRQGDEAALDRFLVQHADTTLFLRSNLASGGIVDQGKPYQATYAASFDKSTIVAAAALCWNGSLLVEAPRDLSPVCLRAVASANRAVSGILGPHDQVEQARDLLGLRSAITQVESADGLFSLFLRDLRVPSLLSRPGVLCRPPREDELELLTRWRVQYHKDAFGVRNETPELQSACREEMARYQADRCHWLLEVDSEPVAYSAFNARVPDCVQVGGVFTPSEWRSRGYGRAIVGGTLITTRDNGVTRAVLFTESVAGEKAYRALGFERVGTYGMTLFEQAHEIEASRLAGQMGA